MYQCYIPGTSKHHEGRESEKIIQGDGDGFKEGEWEASGNRRNVSAVTGSRGELVQCTNVLGREVNWRDICGGSTGRSEGRA